MRTRLLMLFAMIRVLMMAADPAAAHFGAIIPSDDIVDQDDDRTLTLELRFLHPFAGHSMEMAEPERFGVLRGGERIDLRDSLREAKAQSPDRNRSCTFWKAAFRIRRPGDHTFYMVPEPYWEPAEDVFIIHCTKVCVPALGLEQGWDRQAGLETEIVPLTRPYGLWTGNLFTGRVLLEGRPVPGAEVEVEYLNASPGNISKIVAPADPYVTQVVKADAAGVFSYAMPKAGWWGFAALNEASRTIKHEGQEKGVEIGAVFWVHTRDMR